MTNFKATYEINGKRAVRLFSSDHYTEETARAELNSEGVKNFLFFFEPFQPSELPNDNVLFSGEVGFDITLDIMAPYLEAGKNILLNTPGGSLHDGLQIHDAIKELYPETKIGVLGMCASAGTVIFCGAKLENRSMSDNSRFMIHNALIFSYGNHNDLRKMADFLERESTSVIENVYVPATGKSAEDLASFMDEEKFIMKNEVVEWGFLSSKNENADLDIDNNTNIKNDLDMTTQEVEDKLKDMTSMLAEIKNRINPQNIVLKDVTGVELRFPEVDDENEINKGTKVEANGAPANGEFVMSNKTIICDNGLVTDVRNAEEGGEGGEGGKDDKDDKDDKDKEIEKLKEENKALKEEIKQLKDAKNEADDEIKNLKKENDSTIEQVNQLNTVVNELKTAFPKLDSNGASGSSSQTVEHNGKRPKFSYKKKK